MNNENRVGLNLYTLAKLQKVKERLELENPENSGLKVSEVIEYLVNRYESEVGSREK